MVDFGWEFMNSNILPYRVSSGKNGKFILVKTNPYIQILYFIGYFEKGRPLGPILLWIECM